MKRIIRVIAVIMAFTILSSSFVYAADDLNQHSKFFFVYSGLKGDSSEKNVKPNDGDYNAYITTLSSYDGTISNVFSYGGIFYARTRLDSNMEGVYSNLFTFYGIESQVQSYPSGMAHFGAEYRVRAEVDVSIGSGALLAQCVRWCP